MSESTLSGLFYSDIYDLLEGIAIMSSEACYGDTISLSSWCVAVPILLRKFVDFAKGLENLGLCKHLPEPLGRRAATAMIVGAVRVVRRSGGIAGKFSRSAESATKDSGGYDLQSNIKNVLSRSKAWHLLHDKHPIPSLSHVLVLGEWAIIL
jgi:hypothetical protein